MDRSTGTVSSGFQQYLFDKVWPLPGKPKDYSGFNSIDLCIRALVGSDAQPVRNRLRALLPGRSGRTLRDWQIHLTKSPSSATSRRNGRNKLLKLPGEILNLIDSYLELPTQIMFRLSSRQLFTRMDLPTAPSPSSTPQVTFATRKEIRRLLYPDRVNLLQQLEKVGGLLIRDWRDGTTIPLFYCSECQTAHPEEYFPANFDRSLGAERVCRALPGGLEIKYTHNPVYSYIRSPNGGLKRLRYVHLRNLAEDQGPGYRGKSLGAWYCEQNRRAERKDMYEEGLRRPVLGCRQDFSLGSWCSSSIWEEEVGILKLGDERSCYEQALLCRHARVKQDKLAKIVENILQERPDLTSSHDSLLGSWIACTRSSCATTVELHAYGNSTDDSTEQIIEVVMVVLRKLKIPNHPNSSRWKGDICRDGGWNHP